MKLLYTIFSSILQYALILYLCYLFGSHLEDVKRLKADYSMLYSEIEQLKSKIESMEVIE